MGINGLIEISYHQSVTNLQASWGEFSAPFDRADWFALVEQTSGVDTLYAVARAESSAAILPLKRDASVLNALTNWYSFHWQPLLSGPDSDELLAALCRDLKSQSSRLNLAPVPDDGAASKLLSASLQDAGWLIFESPCDTNHILNVDGRDYAAYLAERPGKLRTTLKRKAKKVEIQVSERFDAEMWADYEDIYADSWKPEEGEPAMLRAFAEQEGAAGRIRLAVAKHEGRAVAAQFWTVEHGIAYIHKLAHRKDATKISPGTSLTAALFEYVIDRDHVDQVDFGTGDDPYKRDWMEEARQRVRLECFVATKPSNWPAIAKRMVHNLAQRDAAS